jgi:hypothetical protein
MSDKISVAQYVFDSINRKSEPVSDEELLPKLLPLIKEFPDAQEALGRDIPTSGAVLTPTARKLHRLRAWADGVLSEDPRSIDDFARWAQHVAVFAPGRKKALGLLDKPSESARLAAISVIDMAWKFGIRGVKERPASPITYSELWNIIDGLNRAIQGPSTGTGNPECVNILLDGSLDASLVRYLLDNPHSAGWTNKEFADHLDVHVKSISRRRTPTFCRYRERSRADAKGAISARQTAKTTPREITE